MVEHLLGRIGVDRLTTTIVECWLLALEECGPHTAHRVRQARAVLGRILRDAERDGLVGRNPVRLARPVSVPPPAVTV